MRVRFWLKNAMTNLGAIVGASAIYGLLMSFQMDEFDWETLAVILPLYLVLFGAMMMLALNVGVYKTHLNLCLSFGSTRREALTGLHLNRLIPVVILTAIVTLLCGLTKDKAIAAPLTVAAVTLGLCLFMEAFGAVLGMVMAKFGKVASVICGIVLFVVCLGCGVATGLGIVADVKIASILTVARLPWIALAVGAAAYVVTAIPEIPLVKHYQVKM